MRIGQIWCLGIASLLVVTSGCKRQARDKTPPAKKGGGEAGWVLTAQIEKHVQLRHRKKRLRIYWAQLAEVVRGKRRAAIFYPAIVDNQVVDNDLVAIVFERRGGAWKQAGGDFGVHRRDGKEALAKRLGGADGHRVIRPCGVPASRLAAFVKRWSDAFRTRLQAGKAAAAMKAYQRLTKALSFNLVVHGTMVQMWVTRAQTKQATFPVIDMIKGQEAIIKSNIGGRSVSASMRLQPCGKGVVLDLPIKPVKQ